MSVEPPPPDWVSNDAAFHHRRSILDGEAARATQSTPRILLQDPPGGDRLGVDGRFPPVESKDWENMSQRAALIGALRRWSDDLAFSTLRRSQLVGFLGCVTVLALAAYGWQRGTLSTVAADGPIVAAGDAPAAPRLSSDQVAWNDDAADGDGRRSTASFASDRALAGDADDSDGDSGAKLFVADGKTSLKGVASSASDNESIGRASGGTGGNTAPLDPAPTGGKRTETTVSVVVRYESCAEAAAAGATPIRLGEPGYRLSLDRDKDGIACENGSTPEDRGDAPVDSSFSNPTTTVPSQPATTTTAPVAGAGTTSVPESTTTSQTPTSSKPTTTTSTTEATTSTTNPTTTTGSTGTTNTGVTTSTTSEPTTSTTAGSTTSSPATTTSTTEAATTSSSATSTSTPTTTSTTTTVEQPPDEPVQPTGSSGGGPT